MGSRKYSRTRTTTRGLAVGLGTAAMMFAGTSAALADQFDVPNSAPEVTIDTSTLTIQPDQNGSTAQAGSANARGVYTINTTVTDLDKLSDLTSVTLCLYRLGSEGDSTCGNNATSGNTSLDPLDTVLMRWTKSNDSFSIDGDGTNTAAITNSATASANNQSYWRLGHGGSVGVDYYFSGEQFVPELSGFVGIQTTIPKGFASFLESRNTAFDNNMGNFPPGGGSNNEGNSQYDDDYAYSDYTAGDTSMAMRWTFHASEAAREGDWGVRVVATDSASDTGTATDTTGYNVEYYGAIESARAGVDFGEVLAGESSVHALTSDPGQNHSAGFVQANGGTDIDYVLAGGAWTGASNPTIATGAAGSAVSGNQIGLDCEANSVFNLAAGTDTSGVRVVNGSSQTAEEEQFLNATTSGDTPGRVLEDYANQVSAPTTDTTRQSCMLKVGDGVTKGTYSKAVTVSLTEGAANPAGQ